jgi:hypothetical protein
MKKGNQADVSRPLRTMSLPSCEECDASLGAGEGSRGRAAALVLERGIVDERARGDAASRWAGWRVRKLAGVAQLDARLKSWWTGVAELVRVAVDF